MNFLLAEVPAHAGSGMMLQFDSFWIFAGMLALIGTGLGYYLVRMDQDMHELQKENVRLAAELSSLKAQADATRLDQTIIKTEMSAVRDAILRLIPKRRKLLKWAADEAARISK
jgi:hypothetical protein